MSKRTIHGTLIGAVAGLLMLVGCASAPKSRQDQQAMDARAQATLQSMVASDPSLREVLDRSAGYVVFPSVGEGAALVGGAHGVGVVYENGRPIGFATLTQATVGAQLGGQTYSQLIVFQTPQALNRLKSGNFNLTASASATALTAGAAARADFEGGTAVFIQSQGGLMAAANVGGQQINFEPLA
jgi:lipid-binding SYLF domain-containing protein